MKISHVKISNVLGIRELEFDAGAFNEISGANGVNKTSVLNAIKAVIEGGHDATLLLNGADKGEVVLMLDEGVELKKVVTARDSKTTVKANGVSMKRPMDTINAIADLFSVNPIAFLTAPKAERAKVLIESLPIDLDEDKLAAIAGFKLPPFHPGTHATAKINHVRQAVYDARTEINRSLTEKRATIEQLSRAMPDAPAGVTADEAELRTQLEAIVKERTDAIMSLDEKVSAWKSATDAKVESARRDYETAVDDLKRQIAALTDDHQTFMRSVDAQRATAKERELERRSQIMMDAQERSNPIKAQLSVIDANRNAAAKREQAMETIRTLTEEVDVKAVQSEDATETLKAIDAYKMELLSTMPIPGIEVVNGEVFRSGVPFDRLNTAQRTDIAIELARMRAGKLGCVCVDGLELLDPDAFDAFRAKALNSGLQFFVTRVGRGDLTINALDAL